MINKLHLLRVSNFIALGIYFLFGTKFFWKEETDTCFNVECVLLGRNFNFLGAYLVVNARYLMVTTGYCSLPSSYCSLLVVTARYRSLLLVPTFSMNDFCCLIHTSPILSIHGRFLYFTIWFADAGRKGSHLAYSAVSRSLILEKKAFRICFFLISLSTISSFFS